MGTSPSGSYASRWRGVGGVLVLLSAQLASPAAESELTTPQQAGVLRGELERAGQPWPKGAGDGVAAAIKAKDEAALHRALAAEVFATVQINPEGRVKIARGPAAAELVAGRPRLFLVRVENASGGRQLLTPSSRYVGAPRNPFALAVPTVGTLTPELVGHAVEYRLLEVACKTAGKHEVTLVVEAGQGSQDLGFRAEVPVLFTVAEPPR